MNFPSRFPIAENGTGYEWQAYHDASRIVHRDIGVHNMSTTEHPKANWFDQLLQDVDASSMGDFKGEYKEDELDK